MLQADCQRINTYLVYREQQTPDSQAKAAMQKTDPVKDIILSYQDYRAFKIGEELPKVKIWKIERNLYLTSTEDCLVLSKVSHISFPFLKFIKLAQNRIATLEPFVWMDAPQLQSIILWKNPITHLRAFRKVRFPALLGLQLTQCPIADCVLSELNCPALQKFLLDNTFTPSPSVCTFKCEGLFENKNQIKMKASKKLSPLVTLTYD